jgi:undecaprenyl diphosphate synthase
MVPDNTTDSLPRHIAIIMDGNGRWARSRLLPRYVGHREGVKSVRRAVEACIDQHIEVLTLFAFSSENWRRPSEEVSLIMDLFVKTLKKEVASLNRNGVRLRFIGERSAFSSKLQYLIAEAEQETSGNSKLDLVIAANYGGQWDISQAVRTLAERVQAGELLPQEINPEVWQLAYTELYFTDVLWPAFNEKELQSALLWYANRQRRFGRTGEQVEQQKGA